ncbi:MAG: ComF family protein [Bacteroidales bacterium]|nr:ComF family protein [Bacteroidales bacterium]
MFRTLFSVSNFLLPRYCCGCKKIMNNFEDVICAECLCELGRSWSVFEDKDDLRKRTSIYYPIKNSGAFIIYAKDSKASSLIAKFKYGDDVIIGKYLMKSFSYEVRKLDWINDIDLIIPLPLHWRKTWSRGYNQSEVIANEIGKIFNIRVETKAIKRVKHNKSQVRKSPRERWSNVENIFKLCDHKKLEGKHVLIVDDIVTTGASINSCVKEISKVKDIEISVIALGVTESPFGSISIY